MLFRSIKKLRKSFKFTIGLKIAFAFFIILILIGVVMGFTIKGWKIIIEDSKASNQYALKQAKAGNIRFYNAELLMYVNDYIITENKDYQQLYLQHNTKVRKCIQDIVTGFELSKYELAIMDSISANLDSINMLSEKIFAVPHPRSSDEVIAMMEKLDYTYGSSLNQNTTEFFDMTHNKIEDIRIKTASTAEMMLKTIFIVFFLCLLTGIVVVILSIRYITKPIKMLVGVATAIANGDYSQRPVVKTRDEISLLAHSFSRMSEAIEKSYRKLEKSDKLKTTFISNISHELRTPLNGIIGIARLLAETDIPLEEKQEYVGYLEEATDRLIETITSYIDVSLIVSGGLQIDKKSFKIQQLLTELSDLFMEQCAVKNLELRLQLPEETGSLSLYSDRALLNKALVHLLNNAVKFTNTGDISFGYARKDDMLEFFIKDTGIGFGKRSLKKAFESFEQEEITSTRAYQGSGLGLAISKGIINEFGGEIRIETEVGIGSTIYFTLPIDKPPIQQEI